MAHHGAWTSTSSTADGPPRPDPAADAPPHRVPEPGPAFGAKQDGTCYSITALDSRTRFPVPPERFYAAGEERAELDLPPGYGYPVRAADRWTMTWMLMNHRARTDRRFIRYRSPDDAPGLTAGRAVLARRAQLPADPVYDVPGGGAAGRRTDVQRPMASPGAGAR